MIEKKKRIVQDNAEDGLPVVPSISNIDDLTAFPADFSEDFGFPESFPESENTEPEAILEIPSFLGLDTLDVATAVIQTIHDFPRDSLDSLDSFNTFRKLPKVSDYINRESSQAQREIILEEIPDFDSLTESDTENLPEIPSFLDHDPDLNSDFDRNAENLPDISDFLNFSHDLENSEENTGSDQDNQNKELTIPEKPENFSMSGNLQDLQAAAQEILPEIPSVSDLPDLDFFRMPGNSVFCPEFSEHSGNSENSENLEENSLLPDIPSVSNENWDEKINTESGKNSDFTENPENPESVPIAELPLSLTALHYLQKIEIHDSLELLETSKEELESIPEIDDKTLREILQVRQLQKQNQTPEQPVSEEFELLLELFLKDLERIGVSEKRQIRLKAYLRAVRPAKTEKTACFAAWYQEPHVQMQLDKHIKGLLRKRQMSGLSVNMLADSLPRSLDREILTGMLREMLRADRLMESRDGFYTLKYPPVLKFLADNTDQKQQHIQVLQQRMDGMTPEEIAEKSGISKEHVLRIQNRTLRLVQKLCLINRTSVYEERFRPLYESYELNQEVFGILTRESEQVFRYLELVAFPGNKQPDEVFTDLNVPGWVRENWRAYRNKIKIN